MESIPYLCYRKIGINRRTIDEYVPKLGEMGIFEFYRLNFLKENSDGI